MLGSVTLTGGDSQTGLKSEPKLCGFCREEISRNRIHIKPLIFSLDTELEVKQSITYCYIHWKCYLQYPRKFFSRDKLLCLSKPEAASHHPDHW